jgi:hypothetical protein
MTSGTHNRLTSVLNRKNWEGRFYEDVSAIDVRAILNNHAHLEPGALDDLAALMAGEADEPHLLGVANRADATAQLFKRSEYVRHPEIRFLVLLASMEKSCLTVTTVSPGAELARRLWLPQSCEAGACRLKRKPGVEDIMLAVDRELAEHGLLDATACLFRGCHICLMQLPDDTCPSVQEGAQVCLQHTRATLSPDMLVSAGSRRNVHLSAQVSMKEPFLIVACL